MPTPKMVTSIATPAAPVASSTAPTDFWSQPVDKQALQLTRAIALQEGGGKQDYQSGLPGGTPAGGDGEVGAYQWMPGEFEADAKAAGLDPTDMSPTNQDKVAYFAIKQQKDQGKSPPEIASWWNSGDYNSYQPGTKQKKGNTPAYAQGVYKYFQQLSSGQQPTPPNPQIQNNPTGVQGNPMAPTPPAPENPIIGAVKSVAGAIGTQFKDDFTGLGNLLQAPKKMIMSGSPTYPGGGLQMLSDIGGSIGALADIGMGVGMFAEDVASGGVATPADVPEAAGYTALRTGVGAAVKSGLAKFAAGQGIGLAAQGAASGAETGLKAKAGGASTGKAVAEGAISAAGTIATFKLMNAMGPAIVNKFTSVVSHMKIGDFVQSTLNHVTDSLSKLSQSDVMEKFGSQVKTTLSSAASSIIKMNSSIFKTITDNMHAPTNKEIDSMVGQISAQVTSGGNAAVENVFKEAKTALAPFAAKVGDISKIVGGILQGAGGVVARGSEEFKAAQKAMLPEGEMTIQQALQTAVAGMKKTDTVAVSDLLDVINAPTKSVADSKVKSAVWDAIRSAVGDSEEGLAALDQYAHAQSTRAAQTFNSGLMDAIRTATANPESLLPAGQKASQNTWQGFVSAVWDHIKTPGDVDQLKAALGGTETDLRNFGSMLSKKVVYDAISAYQVAAGNVRNATVDSAHAATAAFQKTIEGYTKKLTGLGLVDPETIHFLQDMGHGIPDVETIAKNAGIDLSKVVDETGKPFLQIARDAKSVLPLTEEELGRVMESPVGKFLSNATTDFRGMPTALLKTSNEALTALKRSMPEDDWKMMGAMTLGKILQTVNGLWNTTDRTGIEQALNDISAKVEGDKRVFDTIFGEQGTPLLKSLVNYGSALEKEGPSRLTSALKNAAASATFGVIHHVYLSAIFAQRAIQDVLSEGDKTLLDQVANMTKSQVVSEYRKAAAEGLGVPKVFADFASTLMQVLTPIFKYTVANKLPQLGVPATTSGVENILSPKNGASGDTSSQ